MIRVWLYDNGHTCLTTDRAAHLLVRLPTGARHKLWCNEDSQNSPLSKQLESSADTIVCRAKYACSVRRAS